MCEEQEEAAPNAPGFKNTTLILFFCNNKLMKMLFSCIIDPVTMFPAAMQSLSHLWGFIREKEMEGVFVGPYYLSLIH
jgi:hypothetical protein